MPQQKSFLNITEIKNAIYKATDMYDDSAPDKRAISSDSNTRGEAYRTDISAKINAKRNAKANQKNAVELANESFEALTLIILDHLDSVIRKVKRKALPTAALMLYNLRTENPILPAINSRDDAKSWARVVATADAQVVANGWNYVKDPTAAEVAAALSDFNTKLTDLTAKEVLYKDAEKALSDKRDEYYQFVKKIWAEILAFFHEEKPSKRRAYARLWGVKFVKTDSADNNFEVIDILAGETVNVEFEDLKDNTIIEIIQHGNVPVWMCRIDSVTNSCLNKGIKIMPNTPKTTVTALSLGASANNYINITNPDEENDGQVEIYIHTPEE